MRKIEIQLWQYTTRLQELNNYLPMLPRSDESNIFPKEELIKIPMHAVPNTWANQEIMLGFNFESKNFCSAFEAFQMYGGNRYLLKRFQSTL